MSNLRASPGQRNAGLTYLFLTNVKAYQALADTIPKPYPFPAEASKQFAELRQAVDRIDSHFRALLDYVEHLVRNPTATTCPATRRPTKRWRRRDPDNPRVVFLGDSITDGWRLNEYFPERDFINRGISGQITGEMLGRMQADVIEPETCRTGCARPGPTILRAGVKQSTIEDNLAMIATLAKAHGIKVILASVLPINDYNKEKDSRFERSRQRPPVRHSPD